MAPLHDTPRDAVSAQRSNLVRDRRGSGPARLLADAWRRGQRGWPARFPVAQLPNPPLLFATAGWLLDRVAGGSGLARAAFYAGLAAWAWLELADGANWFRRALGAAGLAYVVVAVCTALEGTPD